ncbi:sigma-70 family RNA polymerase sigma factor [Leptolyngbya sp. NIES-2104]|uniref:sigma-70 family RNA polymerase sigma factor n=1 Tax=Leptolyngbya sp. NIES-2104 TaxID=1552121 RepID=UPI0006EC81DD|nr:sigma-70 family RNA polymerase sigma factor [Leptolyngbya sp. NIES-2104]GAP99775.1 cyanobacteria-specific RpoD-like sigma factor, type-3 [Leptolyngbya sp. NIES-2104]
METDRAISDSMQLYLNDIGRFPLLNAAEELQYGQQVQTLMQLQQLKIMIANQLHREPTIAQWAIAAKQSEPELTEAIAAGSQAKQKLLESNLRFVVLIAKRYQKRNVDLLDLIQEGSLGLERAIEKFDPAKQYRFSTYAYWWIRQSITRYLALYSRTLRLPTHVTEKLNKIKKAQRTLSQQLRRTATVSEIAQETSLSPEQVREYLIVAKYPRSLDQPISDAQETVLRDLLESEYASPEENLTRAMLQQDIQSALDRLSERERKILILRFGLIDGKALSLSQIGNQLHLSKERVRQLERQALGDLRQRTQLQMYLAV